MFGSIAFWMYGRNLAFHIFYVGCMPNSQLDNGGNGYDNRRLASVLSIWHNFALVRL